MEVVYAIKRKYDEMELPSYKRYNGPVQHLKEGIHDNSLQGLLKLFSFIEYDLSMVYSYIEKDQKTFLPYVRGHQMTDVESIIEDILNDIDLICNMDIKMCKHDKICKNKECCRFIHSNDVHYVSTIFRRLQEYTNRYLDTKSKTNASLLMRQLEHLRNATWVTYSRKI